MFGVSWDQVCQTQFAFPAAREQHRKLLAPHSAQKCDMESRRDPDFPSSHFPLGLILTQENGMEPLHLHLNCKPKSRGIIRPNGNRSSQSALGPVAQL